MAMYEMKPEYMTGIDFIDKEHAQLFSIANRAYELLKMNLYQTSMIISLR